MPFDIDTEIEGDILRVALSGELDMGTVPQFRDAVEDESAPWRTIAIDASDLAFMDSSGLQELVRLNNLAREHQFELVLVRPSVSVVRLLELTGLEQHFTVRD